MFNVFNGFSGLTLNFMANLLLINYKMLIFNLIQSKINYGIIGCD